MAIHDIVETLGAVALMFMAYTLNDLKARIVRIENHIFKVGK